MRRLACVLVLIGAAGCGNGQPAAVQAPAPARDVYLDLVETAGAHLDAGRTAQAEAAFARALDLRPARAEAWFGRGMCRFGRGDWLGAAGDFGAAIQREPGNAAYHAARGRAYQMAGLMDAARADLRRAAELDPGGHGRP